MLEVKDISVRYGSSYILNGLSFQVNAGDWMMLIGPNGAGKSTSLGAIAQTIPCMGEILIEGIPARTLKPKELARKVGFLSQQHYVGYSFRVEDVVRLGCYSRRRSFLKNSPDNTEKAVEDALALTGMEPLRNRSVLHLSGGELQRTFLAQVLAQDPDILLLDEPANHLDLIYQQQVFSLIDAWRKCGGQNPDAPKRAVISVVHDLSLARRYGTCAVLMDKGRAVASGKIDEVMTPEHLNAVYGTDVKRWIRSLYEAWT